MLEDMLGNTLNAGDYILYTQSAGRSSSRIIFCRVVRITITGNKPPVLIIEKAERFRTEWRILKTVPAHNPSLSLKIPFDFLPLGLRHAFSREPVPSLTNQS